MAVIINLLRIIIFNQIPGQVYVTLEPFVPPSELPEGLMLNKGARLKPQLQDTGQ